MPIPIKAKLGDLVKIIDFKTGAVTTIEIDSTRKSSTGLVINTPPHIAISLVKCKHREDPAFQHGVPMIGVDIADPDSAVIVEQAPGDGLPNLHTQPDTPPGSEASA